MDELSPRLVSSIAGFFIGIVFGAVVQRTNFCTMGAVSDAVLFQNMNRLRAWLLAIAVAMIGTQALAALELVDLTESIYLGSRLTWAGAIVGGLLFGLGMVFSGGCGNRNLVRFGAGDLRSLVVLVVMGITAGMTLYGLMAFLRLGLNDATAVELSDFAIESQGLPSLLAAGFGVESGALQVGLGWLIGAGLLIYCFSSAAFRSSARNIVGGLTVGMAVVTGWWATGVLAYDDFEPVPLGSVTFVAPVGDGILYLMTFTGSSISFGIATAAGIILGAFVAALATGTLHLQSFGDKADLVRSLLGAVMMGFGGVTALGCTIGQGITGVSTLALGSFLALGAIIVGAILALRLLEHLEV